MSRDGVHAHGTVYTRDNLRPAFTAEDWKEYRKVATTLAVRIIGPFTVKTREGVLTCPNGYLAVDAHGWPYPIAYDEFERIYDEMPKAPPACRCGALEDERHAEGCRRR